ncbi:hypothetical protein ACP70R_043212 [Stipagrostis hirtigluma subsp. patula]
MGPTAVTVNGVLVAVWVHGLRDRLHVSVDGVPSGECLIVAVDGALSRLDELRSTVENRLARFGD